MVLVFIHQKTVRSIIIHFADHPLLSVKDRVGDRPFPVDGDIWVRR